MNIKYYIIISVGLIFICFLSIYIFTLPYFLERYNLTDTGNIGSTIGGITAPILGIISSVFLYIALIKQIDSNEKSRLKNESDILFLLLNQLDTEYDKFYYNYSKGLGNEKIEFKYTGIEGMNKFVNDFVYEWTRNDVQWSSTFQAKQISLLIGTFKLIDKRINMSKLDKTLKDLFQQKIKSIYICKFHTEFKLILSKCKENIKGDYLLTEMQDAYDYFNDKFKM